MMSNYINDDIKIKESVLHKLIRDCIKDLEKYDKEEDEINYIYALDNLDVTAKSYVIAGKITEKDYHKLLQKYGGE